MRTWLFLAALLPIAIHAQMPFNVDLQTEHLYNPIGLDTKQPRFTWRILDFGQGFRPVTYAFIVGDDSTAVAHGKGNQWQRQGKDDSSVHLYGGKPLKTFTKYYFQVRFGDGQRKMKSSPVSSFETGMMEKSNWKGNWISDTRDIRLKPAAYFRKGF